jgi:hypothetical protein
MGGTKTTVYDLAKQQWMLSIIRLPEAPARQEDAGAPEAAGAAPRAEAGGDDSEDFLDDGRDAMSEGKGVAGAAAPDGLAEVVLSDDEDALAHLSDDDDEGSSEGGWSAERLDRCADACSLMTCRCVSAPSTFQACASRQNVCSSEQHGALSCSEAVHALMIISIWWKYWRILMMHCLCCCACRG